MYHRSTILHELSSEGCVLAPLYPSRMTCASRNTTRREAHTHPPRTHACMIDRTYIHHTSQLFSSPPFPPLPREQQPAASLDVPLHATAPQLEHPPSAVPQRDRITYPQTAFLRELLLLLLLLPGEQENQQSINRISYVQHGHKGSGRAIYVSFSMIYACSYSSYISCIFLFQSITDKSFFHSCLLQTAVGCCRHFRGNVNRARQTDIGIS